MILLNEWCLYASNAPNFPEVSFSNQEIHCHKLLQVHTSKKACVASYPCTVQNDILWFWPNSDPEYQDILTKKQPPYIAEIDDPSYAKSMGTRDIPYGYVLVRPLYFLGGKAKSHLFQEKR